MATVKHVNDKDQNDFVGNEKEEVTESKHAEDGDMTGVDKPATDSELPVRTGKRPRIRKPLFSVSFPKE